MDKTPAQILAEHKPMDHAQAIRHIGHFARGFITPPGAPLPISRTLARILHVSTDDADLDERARLYAESEREIFAGDPDGRDD